MPSMLVTDHAVAFRDLELRLGAGGRPRFAQSITIIPPPYDATEENTATRAKPDRAADFTHHQGATTRPS